MKQESSPSAGDRGRRTEGTRIGGRSERVVSTVLAATHEELGRVGYDALRVEDVAERSGVAKTTIYRRWPTKAELVAASLRVVSDEHDVPDTGSLRGDLLAMAMKTVHMCQTPTGRGILRMLQVERADPEVEVLAQALRERRQQRNRALLERAIARGELPKDVNTELLLDLIFAFVYVRVIFRGGNLDEDSAAAAIDTVLAGMHAGAARLPPTRKRKDAKI